MDFRPAQPKDAVCISDLVQRLSRDFVLNADGSGADQFWESVSETAEAGYIASDRYNFIVALDGREIAGFIAIRDLSHLFHLFVASQFQGKGLASQLWEQAKAQAAASGAPGTFTVNSSLTAVPVYERFGFVRTGEVVKTHGIAFLPMQMAAPNQGQYSS